MRQMIRLLARSSARVRLVWSLLALSGVCLLVLFCSLDEPQAVRQPLAGISHREGAAYFAPCSWRTFAFEEGRLVLAATPELLEDGKPLYRTLGFASRIAERGQGRFRFQGGGVLFSASDNGDPRLNGRTYELVVQRTPVAASPAWLALAVAGLLAALALAVIGPGRGLPQRLREWANAVTAFILLFPPLLGLALALAYVGCVAAALAKGHALPLAAPYLFFPAFRNVARVESYWPHILLAWAGLGALLGWAYGRRGGAGVRAAEAALARLLRRTGLFLVLALFLFSLGSVWGAAATGISRLTDLHGTTFSGLLPMQDGVNYFFDPHIQADTGRWALFPVRRPVACAMRSVVAVLAGFQLPGYLTVQASLLAAAAFLAALAVARWRGTWAGIAFLGLLGIFGRMFLAVSNTDPIGLILSCLTMALLVHTLRRPSLASHVLAMCAVAFTLLARPGPLLILPALLVWSWWRFRKQRSLAIKAAGSFLLIMALGAGYQYLEARLYGMPEYVGTTDVWYLLTKNVPGDETWKELQKEFGNDYNDLGHAKRVGKVAMDNLKQHPEVILRRLREGLAIAPIGLAYTLIDGYDSVKFPRPLLPALAVVLVLGLAHAALKRRGKAELSFWVLALAGLLVSNLLLFQFDGRRNASAAYPYFWLLLSAGFSAPSRLLASGASSPPALDRRLATGLLALLVAACLILPGMAHRASPPPPRLALPEDGSAAMLVKGGRTMAGFLLLPDGAPVRTDAPAMPLRTFLANARPFAMPSLQALSKPDGLTAPVACVVGYAPQRTTSETFNYFYAPVEVLLRPEVPYWFVRLERRADSGESMYGFWSAIEVRPVQQDGTLGEPLPQPTR